MYTDVELGMDCNVEYALSSILGLQSLSERMSRSMIGSIAFVRSRILAFGRSELRSIARPVLQDSIDVNAP